MERLAELGQLVQRAGLDATRIEWTSDEPVTLGWAERFGQHLVRDAVHGVEEALAAATRFPDSSARMATVQRTARHHGGMRYLTRGMVNGDLDDDEIAQVRAAYAWRLEAITPRLPAPVRELARLSLHDGWFEAVEWEPADKRLRLSLVTWQSSGYRAVTLSYSGALLGVRRVQTLRDAARDRETQILESEVDGDDNGVLSHRLLLWPRDELTIDFTGLRLETAARQDDRVSLRPFFVEILPGDTE